MAIQGTTLFTVYTSTMTCLCLYAYIAFWSKTLLSYRILSLDLRLSNSPRVGEGIIASEPKPLATGDGPASGRWQRAAVSLPAQPEPRGWKVLTERAHAERRQQSNLLHTG